MHTKYEILQFSLSRTENKFGTAVGGVKQGCVLYPVCLYNSTV